MTSTAEKLRPRIATMASPSPEDEQAAVVVSVFHARELLSSVERAILDLKETSARVSTSPRYPPLFATLEAATTNLLFAAWLFNALDKKDTCTGSGVTTPQSRQTHRIKLSFRRAEAAALAALGHGRLAESYSLFTADEKMSLKMHSHWHKATELARQEAHRALAQLAEFFPDAYDVEAD